jgi:phosphoribosylaminoimidazole-succinocarboxamide synthase
MTICTQQLQQQLANTLEISSLPGLGAPQHVGMLDCYTLDEHVLCVVTDRVGSVHPVSGTIPFKGQTVTRTALWWLDSCQGLIVSPIVDVVDAQALVLRRLRALPARCVVYGYLTAGLARAYESGARQIAGVTLPDGLESHCRLDEPVALWAADSRAAAQGSFLAPESVRTDPTPASADPVAQATELATKLYHHGQRQVCGTGLVLASAGYTFGTTESDAVTVRGLLHTADTCVYWLDESPGEAPTALDEESMVGQWLTGRQRSQGLTPLDNDIRTALGEAHLTVATRLVTEFDPQPIRVVNRLSCSLSLAGLLA